MKGPLLKAILLKKQISPNELAKQIKRSPATVYNMMSGKRPSLGTIKRVCDYLGVPLQKLAPDVVKKHKLPLRELNRLV